MPDGRPDLSDEIDHQTGLDLDDVSVNSFLAEDEDDTPYPWDCDGEWPDEIDDEEEGEGEGDDE